MKKIFLLMTLVLSSMMINAQEEVDLSSIGFTPKVNNPEGKIPENVVKYIESNVNRALTHKGVAQTGTDFLISIDVVEVNRSMTPTAPPNIQMSLEVVFQAIDVVQEVVFNTVTIPVVAMERSDAKAYMKAARNLNLARSRNFINFIDVSKQKLYDYYKAGYATKGKKEVEEKEVLEKEEIELNPVVEDSNNKQELFSGVYAEYVGVEKLKDATAIKVKLTNTNTKDFKVDFRWTEQLLIDDTGNNVKHRHITNKDFKYIHEYILAPNIPHTIWVHFRGDLEPKVFFLEEKNTSKKLRFEL